MLDLVRRPMCKRLGRDGMLWGDQMADESVSEALRGAGFAMSADLADTLQGSVRLQYRDGDETREERFIAFRGEIIRYVANWEIVGEAVTAGGARTPFSCALDEDENILSWGFGSWLWRMPKTGPVRVINAHKEAELFIRQLQPVLSDNEPAWAIMTDTVFYAKDVA
jgi:hypothetical protein